MKQSFATVMFLLFASSVWAQPSSAPASSQPASSQPASSQPVDIAAEAAAAVGEEKTLKLGESSEEPESVEEAAAPSTPIVTDAPKDTRLKYLDYYDEGVVLFNEGRLEEAINAFKDGWRLFAAPEFLFSIAQCYRQLEDNRRAALYFRGFIDHAPKSELVPSVRALIDELGGVNLAGYGASRAINPPKGLSPVDTALWIELRKVGVEQASDVEDPEKLKQERRRKQKKILLGVGGGVAALLLLLLIF
jgi:TolA-binding protein